MRQDPYFSDTMHRAFYPSSTFFKYMLRSIVVPFLMGVAVILMALSLERLLRLMEIATSEGAGISVAIELLGYLQPHYLGLAIPAASFLSVLFMVRKLYDYSEYVVMQSSGVSPLRLLIPIGCFACIAFLLMMILVDFAQPHSRYGYRAELQMLQADGTVFRAKPGVFQRIGDNTTLRAEQVSSDGRSLYGVFANVKIEQQEGNQDLVNADEVIIVANRAVMQDREKSAGDEAELTLMLSGAQIISNKEGQKPSLLTASQYPLQIPLKNAESFSPRGETERELTLGELLSGGAKGVVVETEKSVLRAEYHARLLHALSVPVLIFLAVPLGLMGQGRTGQAFGFIIGVVVLVLYEKILGFGEAFASTGQYSVYLTLWPSLFILTFVTIICNLVVLQMTSLKAIVTGSVFKTLWRSRSMSNRGAP